jgi:predicted dehydrogenase
MLKIGIIGCGRITDQHATEIQKISGCQIVGVCDSEELMARQMADRFDIKYHFDDVNKLLDKNLDIVHITTPPQSHFALGMKCLEAGSSVFMEKPFTLNTEEAVKLIRKAKEGNLKITVDHNAQFSHAAIRMRQLVSSGYLGGYPVHMESTWCYPFTDPGYAKAILGDSNHWIRGLPGRYLHDILSHGISRIAEFLKVDDPKVVAHGNVSPLLKSIHENDMIDELRVMIYDDENMTAYFTFSSQIDPPIKQFRIYGPKRSLTIDHEHQTVIGTTENYKYYLNHFIAPLITAKEYVANSVNNMKKFIKNEFHYESGRQFLITSFYRSVSDGGDLPISYREIVLTSKIMDDIFEQIYS